MERACVEDKGVERACVEDKEVESARGEIVTRKWGGGVGVEEVESKFLQNAPWNVVCLGVYWKGKCHIYSVKTNLVSQAW